MKSGSFEDALVERDRGVDPFNYKQIQSALHTLNGFGAVATVSDELRHQRIIVRRDDAVRDTHGCRRGCRCHPGD